MPVHSLEIENFKSYGGSQRIGPFNNFTCVIGPNGSGKSNLMDAISFVLGVQSKALRSQQLQDLIYREPGADEQAKKRFGACVTLHYRVTQQEEEDLESDSEMPDNDTTTKNNDNEDKTPPKRRGRRRKATPPSKDDDPEEGGSDGEENIEGRIIRFGRSISPAGVGEYHLDGKRVTWTVYERALFKLGVLVQARNFLVFQGDVEALARKTPTQLAQLFDVLSGSASYKDQYEAAFQEQQEKQQATVLQWQTQKGLRQEKKLLKQQKTEAERFQSLQEEKRDTQTQSYLWQLWQMNNEIDQRQEQLSEAQERVAALKEEQEQAAIAVKESKKGLSTLRRNLGQRQEDDLVRISTVFDNKEPALVAAKAEQADLDKKLQLDEKALKKAIKKADSHKDEIQKIEDDLEKDKEDLKVLEEEYERVKEAATRVKWTQDQEEEYEQVKRQAKAASAQHVTKLQQDTNKLKSLETSVSNTQHNLEQTRKQLRVKEAKAQELKERVDKLTKTLKDTQTESKKADVKLVDLQKTQRAKSQRKHELDVELEKAKSQLRDARAVLHKNKDEERLLRTVKNLKTYTSNGVYGRLADLCRPVHKQYNLAVTVAAGKDMDAIVVDTPQTAQTCIEYLRENRVGTATFLPLSQLQVPTPESTQHLRAMVEQDDRYRLAMDIIAVSDDFPNVDLEKAVHYAVGNTVVCDDLGSAQELCYRRNQRIKAVSLQGAVISKAGTMTGGVTKDDKSKSRWKNVEVEKLQAKHDEYARERAELDHDQSQPQQDLQDLQNQLGSLKNKMDFISSDVTYSKQSFKDEMENIKKLRQQVSKLEDDLKEAQKGADEAEKHVEAAKAAVTAAEEEHLQPFRQRTGLTDLKAYDQAMGKSRENFLESKRILKEHMEQLKQKKVYEEARDVQKPITRIEARISERREALDASQAKQFDLERDIEEARKQLQKAKEAVSELEAEEKEMADQVQEKQQVFDKAKGAAKKAGQECTKQENALERLRGKLHETLQKARVEEVELPMKGEDDEEIEEENSDDEEDMEEDSDENSEGSDEGRQTRRKRKSKPKGKRSKKRRKSDEGSQESGQATSSQTSSSVSQPLTQHFSQAENAVVVRDRQKAASVDFSDLPKDLKKPHNEKEERKVRKAFDDKIAQLNTEIESMTPNMKAAEAFDAVSNKCKENAADYEKAKSEASKAAQEYERIRAKRSQLFLDAFEHIDNALKTIYTDMTKSSKHPLGGNAYLSLDDTEEPYKGGLKFNAMPPMKRFRDMEQLSGGEKTVAALSLLFAIHSFRPAPFFIMDEVDAALDNVNVLKVCNYIRRRSRSDFQCIVISLKDLFYEQADALVGICRDAGMNSSRTLTLDCTQFSSSSATLASPSVASRSSKRRSRASSSIGGSQKRTRRSTVTEDEGQDENTSPGKD